MPTQKIEIVNNLKEEFDSASAYIFADYRGGPLSVFQSSETPFGN